MEHLWNLRHYLEPTNYLIGMPCFSYNCMGADTAEFPLSLNLHICKLYKTTGIPFTSLTVVEHSDMSSSDLPITSRFSLANSCKDCRPEQVLGLYYYCNC